jgi:ferredoxin
MAEGRTRGDPTWRRLRLLRRAVQVAALVFFIVLLFAGLQRRDPLAWTDLFFRFDPLTALATMLAAREWLGRLALAFVTIGVTLVVGRVWCGWICPLGTLLGWFRFGAAQRWETRLPPRLRVVKYVLLLAIAGMAAFGVLTLLVLDPITIITRTATASLLPAFDFLVTGAQRLALQWPALDPAVDWVDTTLRGTVLPITPPRFEQSLILLLVFLAVVALNVLADRFWCRYLCPLGALLGLVAKVQILRPLVGDGCIRCGPCADSCRLGAIDLPDEGSARVTSSECTMCLDCLVACPSAGVVGIGVDVQAGPWREYDPGRRALLAAGAGGLAAGALLSVGVRRAEADPRLLRPPGADDEADFLARCLRCSECMKACPTSGLQPTLGQAGIEGLWTPILVPRIGYCDYGCAACGQVCPSGAIPPLALEDKRRQVIGVAIIDQTRCLPWALNTPCIVCQEMCPVPDKAITLHGQGRGGGGGQGQGLGQGLGQGQGLGEGDGGGLGEDDGLGEGLPQDALFERVARPKVVGDLCIGCGICETKCPVEGVSAIVVRRHP